MAQTYPELAAFKDEYQAGRPQLVWQEYLTDLETPVSALLKLQHISPYHLLYESVEGGETRGRYSIIALKPDLLWQCEGGIAGMAEFSDGELPEHPRLQRQKETVFESLRAAWKASQIDVPAALPPMASGLFGFMGYGMVGQMERLPQNNPDTLGLPDSVYFRPTITVIFDAVKDVAFISTPVWPREDVDADAAYRAAVQRIEATLEQLNAPLKRSILARYYGDDAARDLPFKSHISKADYCAMVEKAKEYILAGDIFQIVPSRRLTAEFTLPPVSLYRALRHLNPSPYLFYIHLKDFALVGSSPEILVKVANGEVTVRPIAGTRKRGQTKAEDDALAEELLLDHKELAEHLMLLDLGRNDVGRVAEGGSVAVTEQMFIERYSHVMHIVSNVTGRLRKDKDALDALIAGFPAGTTSGAPKIRAMEIIDELEKEARSFYSGTVGYLGANGEMDTCIALRTGAVKDGVLAIQAGGGVVADSDPEAEFQETENKAGALMAAARHAVRFV